MALTGRPSLVGTARIMKVQRATFAAVSAQKWPGRFTGACSLLFLSCARTGVLLGRAAEVPAEV